MFGREKNPVSQPVVAPVADEAAPSDGKGRPTPKRKVAEAANKRPLVPEDRKAAQKSARAVQREERDKQYRALQTGDEAAMPAKDKGPVRRYVRDYVDARFTLGEVFLPVAAVFLVVQISFASLNAVVAAIALFGLYFYVIAAIIDGWLLWRRLKKRLVAKFGEAKVVRGTAMYAVMRSFQLRPSRLPKPQVKRRQYPQ